MPHDVTGAANSQAVCDLLQDMRWFCECYARSRSVETLRYLTDLQFFSFIIRTPDFFQEFQPQSSALEEGCCEW